MDLKQFSKIMGTLAVAFPSTSVTEQTNKLYYKCLADLDYEPCTVAIQQLIMTTQFFPTVAEIRRKYTEIANPISNISTIDALEVLNKAVREYGRYRALEAKEWIKKESETLGRIVDAVGFNNICNADLNRFRVEFETLYREADKDVREQAMLSGEVRSKIAQLSGKLRNSALMLEQDDYC